VSDLQRNEIADLHNDFYSLCEKYRESFEPVAFGAMLVALCSKLVFKGAPSYESAADLLTNCILAGHTMSEFNHEVN
jgi:hypothetical protein